jgi:hypothetical protein
MNHSRLDPLERSRVKVKSPYDLRMRAGIG